MSSNTAFTAAKSSFDGTSASASFANGDGRTVNSLSVAVVVTTATSSNAEPPAGSCGEPPRVPCAPRTAQRQGTCLDPTSRHRPIQYLRLAFVNVPGAVHRTGV